METYVEAPPREEPIRAPRPEPAPIAVSHSAPTISDLALFLRRTRALVPVAVVGTFVLALIAFLYFAKVFVMPIVLAALLTFLLKPLVRALASVRIPVPVGAIIVMVAFFTTISFAMKGLAHPATTWASRAPEAAGMIKDRFGDVFRRAARLTQAAAQVEGITQATPDQPATQVKVHRPVFMNTVLTYTRSFLAGGIETVVLLFFMLAAGDLFMQKLVRVLPTLHDKKKAVEIAHEVQHSLSTFLFTITVINTLLGALVGFAAFLIGLPNPVLWGVLAGALNFIPYFGPITGVVVLLIAGFITFQSPLRAVLPSLIYLALHGVESNVITPLILGRRLTLNPLVIFISLMFWTWLWGIPGALLSIPMLMMLKIFCDHFKPFASVGEFISG
jgi:predicted PurR-regulated permease PerM